MTRESPYLPQVRLESHLYAVLFVMPSEGPAKTDRAGWSKIPDQNFACTREKLTCSYKMIHIETVLNVINRRLYACHSISCYGPKFVLQFLLHFDTG